MSRAASDSWSTARSLAFLAATFAIVLGSLMPFAALAASTPGQPIVLCSVEGPRILSMNQDGVDPSHGMAGAKCAACVLIASAPLPTPPVPEPAAPPAAQPGNRLVAAAIATPPPARAPPRPPSTAPPHT